MIRNQSVLKIQLAESRSHKHRSVELLEIEKMMDRASFVRKSLPLLAMILVQFAVIVSATLTKAALVSGLSQYVFIVYYDTLATILFLPKFVHHCVSGKRLPITSSVLCRFFVLSLIGRCLFPILFYTGLSYTSVTVGASIGNLTPIFTFLLAICFRMERVDLRKSTDQIKTFGTIVAVLGALVVTLYKGPALLATHDSSKKMFFEGSKWSLGCFLFTLAFLLRSMWNIFQADTAKLYPDEVTIVFFSSLFGAIQTAFASFFLVKGQGAWKPNNKVEIIAIVNSAIWNIFTYTVLTWCLRKKGPLFVSMFDPLNIAIAAFMGFMFLGDGFYLGSVVGSATIVVGFFAVMWGQAKTTSSLVNKNGGLESASNQVTPLLQNSHT